MLARELLGRILCRCLRVPYIHRPRPAAAMLRCLALLGALALTHADNISFRRQAQQTASDICTADISGPARGVPDGVINVMDVRPIPCHAQMAARAPPFPFPLPRLFFGAVFKLGRFPCGGHDCSCSNCWHGSARRTRATSPTSQTARPTSWTSMMCAQPSRPPAGYI